MRATGCLPEPRGGEEEVRRWGGGELRRRGVEVRRYTGDEVRRREEKGGEKVRK